MPESTRITRIVLEFSESGATEVEAMLADTGLPPKDLTNNAYTLLQWAIEKAKQGRRIIAVDDRIKDAEVLEMPLLTAIQHRADEQKGQ